ncbi:hypothetical protein AcV5_006446 [Taiwanofungus camphoratus]|nr:hypothetical protein AcW2_004886 [Antrodia cinnamomea]KAI0934681.1 hypothetical protein AcV5_006446 [Antrodia cinnamomea]KAI0950031.1 hypothetical protein AcV7_008622 [Antrodia cinnamomea]
MSSNTVVDLAHHLSSEARARKPNPMKEIWKLIKRKPNMVSLANGDPHFSLYPIKKMEFEVASVEEEDPVTSWRTAGPSAPSQTLSSSRDEPCTLSVKTALQYSTGAGLVEAQQAVMELTRFYHSPPDHVCTLSLGNADGVTKCFRLLGDSGDSFLADEFSFSSLTNAGLPQGINWVPLRIDDGGLVPEELERLLAGWNEQRGRRPHVLYTVPCGQNPTGSTLTVERRKTIYEIARRYDLIIIEDDPYYFLQYASPGSGQAETERTLMPSFLSMDVDGRVIRVDTFSKIVAPGMRLGWITSSAMFHQHLVSYTDSSTQHPHGFGQIFVTEMLGARGWQMRGFDRWVRSLCAEYRRRRDFFLGLFEREVGATGLARAASPEAGMFVWIRVNIERHPRYRDDLRITGCDSRTPARTNVRQLMEELFERCLDGGVVVMPGSVFALRAEPGWDDTEHPIDDRLNFLRATFAGTEETMQEGLSILGKVLKEFFEDEQ